MARLTFRQGIVRHQMDTLGNPWFLDVVGGFVNLRVSPDPTIITFVHGTTNYLFAEAVSVSSAWGPFTSGTEYWLYWDLNRVTGIRTFGSTTLEPLEQPVAPTSPLAGQMWFNTTTNLWYEFNGASWVEVVRVFACKLDVTLTPRSMSINAPTFTGTQVGLTGDVRVGALVFDSSGKPIRTGDGKFFTTEDIFTTGVPTGASLRVNNILIPGQAQQPIAAYRVVEYSDFHKLIPASPYTQGVKVYGIVEEDADTNDVVNFVTEGLIYNDDWDWVGLGAGVNDPVFINNTGEIQLAMEIPNQLPVGVIVGPQEILFSPKLFPQVTIVGDGVNTFTALLDTPASYTGFANNLVKVNATEDGLVFVPDPGAITEVAWGDITGNILLQTDLIAALDGKADGAHTHLKVDITDFAHTHPTTDIVGLDVALDGLVATAGDTMNTGANLTFVGGGEVLGLPAVPSGPTAAVSKQYIDTVLTGLNWLDPIMDPNLVGVNVTTPPVSPVPFYETFIIGTGATGDWASFAAGSAVAWNGTNWVDILNRPVAIGDRFAVMAEPTVYPSPNLDASVSADVAKIITIDDDTVGAVTWTSIIPNENDTLFVNNPYGQHFGHIYTFSGDYGVGTLGVDYRWIETGAQINIIAGDFLSFTGNQLNVTEDFSKIFDGDGDTNVRVDHNNADDSDTITMRIGLNPALQIPNTTLGNCAAFSGSGFNFTTPSGATGSNYAGTQFSVKAGNGDGTGVGGPIALLGGHSTTTTAQGGYIQLVGGNGINGGPINIYGGSGSSLGGGSINLFAGDSTVGGVGVYGGSIRLRPGASPGGDGVVLVDRTSTGNRTSLRFMDNTGLTTSYVAFRAPANVSTGATGNGATVTWTLPEGDGTAGQVISTDGAGVLSWVSQPTALPPSTVNWNMLVADTVGGWTERAIPELCHPYDLAAQIFGEAPVNELIFKFVTPQKFRLLDYGHQISVEGFPTAVGAATFTVSRNGSNIGFFTVRSIGETTFNLGGTATNGTITGFNPGDILRIYSPNGDNTNLRDIAITLRGIVEPAVPRGSLSVSFGSSLYSNVAEGALFSSLPGGGVTITGSYHHVEWAVIAVSVNSGANWYSLDNASTHGQGNLGVVFNSTNIIDSESKYWETATINPTIAEYGSNTGYMYKIRCTAFGPFGMATATTNVDFAPSL